MHASPFSFISRSSLIRQSFDRSGGVWYELADGSVWKSASVKPGFANQIRPQLTVWFSDERFVFKFGGGGVAIEVEPVRTSRTPATPPPVHAVSGLGFDQAGSLGALSQTEAGCNA